MKLSDHSLRQLDENYLHALETEALRELSVKLLSDLKEARERLNQGPENSSRPPSSREPWQKSEAEDRVEDESEEEEHVAQPPQGKAEQAQRAAVAVNGRRRAGKQPGAAGHGRTQVFEAQETMAHYATHCAGCGKGLEDQERAVAYTAFQEVDLKWGDSAQPGLHLHVIKHLYYEQTCPCGHDTRAEAHRGEVDPLLAGVTLSEWRVAGPGIAALIVALALRFRLSRARIREFLWDWLGLALSTGTISRTLHEAGAAIAPAEEQLVQEILESGLLHADETPWKEQGHALWLWVFTSLSVTLYYVAHRGKELVENLLENFEGWLMSDGWTAYRWLAKRLRCWAHLIRKARGLAESYEAVAQVFGKQVLATLETLMDAVYAAREGPPGTDLPTRYVTELSSLRQACQRMQHGSHDKARALAVEILNDWEAIFQVLSHPHLPLTNNEAERALRHWVILRKLSYGTRTAQGSRIFALLASVIDTCRQRHHSPWRYLQSAIRDRRAGLPLQPLPVAGK